MEAKCVAILLLCAFLVVALFATSRVVRWTEGLDVARNTKVTERPLTSVSISRLRMRSFRQCRTDGLQHVGVQTQVAQFNRSEVVHVFKNSGTTVNHVAKALRGKIVMGYRPQLPTDFKAVGEAFAKFDGFRTALVRDPVDRVLSSFHEVNVRKFGHMNMSVEERRGFSDQAYLVSMLNETLRSMHRFPKKRDYHFYQQMSFLVDVNGTKLPLDYIGEAGHVRQELSFIFGVQLDRIPFLSGPTKTTTAADNFRIKRDQLTDDLLLLICDLYRVDFCCLGFEFPDVCVQPRLGGSDAGRQRCPTS
eukprot:gb/GFBE01039598.1/.p1 GENE.gb/GFBE01039598.1/~~gb/GFBE01039598.1/.p1  ORF type:complete len:305 (+),score=19.88 gb/GFBE01039598.1/:1-915(+)